MPEFDPAEFVDRDFQSARKAAATSPALSTVSADTGRAPTREELDQESSETQHKLSELKRIQADLERQRAALEETRRRQAEFTQGRQEMVQHLTRGVGLLEEAEFGARRDAEQMAKALVDLREALVKVQSIQEETWTKDSFSVELTRAGTIIENARLEWNSARMKFPLLNGEGTAVPTSGTVAGKPSSPAPASDGLQLMLREQDFATLCKLGLAITWPIALVALAIFLVLLLR